MRRREAWVVDSWATPRAVRAEAKAAHARAVSDWYAEYAAGARGLPHPNRPRDAFAWQATIAGRGMQAWGGGASRRVALQRAVAALEEGGGP